MYLFPGVAKCILVTNLQAVRADVTEENVYKCQEIKNFIDTLGPIFNVQQGNVFPFLSYTDETEVNDEFSKIAMDALLKIFKMAEIRLRMSAAAD